MLSLSTNYDKKRQTMREVHRFKYNSKPFVEWQTLMLAFDKLENRKFVVLIFAANFR
jgi:hypothetical protein